MAIRLYPDTTNVASIEVLAGVPAGTTARLEALERKYPEGGMTDPDALFEALFAKGSEDLNKLHNFHLYGWGKFDSAGVANDCCGELKDLAQIKHLFAVNGISADPALCEGVNWG